MILLDTSVLLDIVKDDPLWGAWSLDAFEAAAARDALAINDIVYAELSSRYESVDEVEHAISTLRLPVLRIIIARVSAASNANKFSVLSFSKRAMEFFSCSIAP